MNGLAVREVKKDNKIESRQISFNWMDNSSIQKLLNVVSFILAEEYIMISKQNPSVFLKPGANK